MPEQLIQTGAGTKRMRLFASTQPHPSLSGQSVDTFHILFEPPCEAATDKTFIPKSKERPASYRLARTQSGRIAELVVERNAIGWSSDREAALLGLARGLAREHNYPLDPSIRQLEPGARTATESVASGVSEAKV